MCQWKPCAASTDNTSHAVEQHRAKFVALQRLNEIETARCSVLLGRPHSLRLRASPKIPAATNGMGASGAIKALLESTEDLLLSPTTTSALSLRRPTDAHRRNSPPSPRAQAAQAPDPRTKSRIPTVRMSRVSVPDPCGKNQPGARTIATPTPTRAAATTASVEVGARELPCTTRSTITTRVGRKPTIRIQASTNSLFALRWSPTVRHDSWPSPPMGSHNC